MLFISILGVSQDSISDFINHVVLHPLYKDSISDVIKGVALHP